MGKFISCYCIVNIYPPQYKMQKILVAVWNKNILKQEI
jgi:hypothetical protein